MKKSKKRGLCIAGILFFLVLSCQYAKAQVDVIEIDTLTNNALKGLPYNKPVTLKIRIETEAVTNVYRITKYKHYDLPGSIGHNIDKGNDALPEIPPNYYNIRKIGDYNYLFITFADDYMLRPSTGYFLMIPQPKADDLVPAFFDKYYNYVITPTAALLTEARKQLVEFNNKAVTIYGATDKFNPGYYDVAAFDAYQPAFLRSFNSLLLTPYNDFSTAKKNLADFVTAQTSVVNTNFPVLDSLTYSQLLLDTTINKEAVQYLAGKDFLLNDVASDLNTLSHQSKTKLLLAGNLALGSIFSAVAKDGAFAKRAGNIENSITALNTVKRALFLLAPKYKSAAYLTNSITNCTNLITTLQSSRDSLKNIISLRANIVEIISTEDFEAKPGEFKNFAYYSVISGDSYLNFETRNKVLLTPDFGLVTSSITAPGKKLDYGIMPYLGFHINIMAVDKDITFKSYRKDWKQYCSVMVGWSLTNANQDSSYSSFFEKSSLLTGVGFRLNNVIRLTAGAQWLFKLGKDNNSNPTKKLMAIPYIGLSFDLNIKQYLNGFVDILSGIGKTKAPPPTTTITTSQ